MDGVATEKHRSTRVLDSARHRQLWNVTGPQSPAHRTPGYQVLKVARRVITIEGLVHHSISTLYLMRWWTGNQWSSRTRAAVMWSRMPSPVITLAA